MGEIMIVKPEEIEKESMHIIDGHLAEMGITLDKEQEPVIKRVIHTSADFDYVKNLKFVCDPIKRGIEALRNNPAIVTDTNMAKSGVSKPGLKRLNGTVDCFIADEDVAAKAKERGDTRAVISMEKAFELFEHPIFAIGNAPTALLRIADFIEKGRKPALVIGVPVGFVNVCESKEHILKIAEEYDIPLIVAMGNKGGSNVAAAICNALIYTLGRG